MTDDKIEYEIIFFSNELKELYKIFQTSNFDKVKFNELNLIIDKFTQIKKKQKIN